MSFGSGATAELDQGVDECGVSVHGGRMKKKRDPRPDWDAYFLSDIIASISGVSWAEAEAAREPGTFDDVTVSHIGRQQDIKNKL